MFKKIVLGVFLAGLVGVLVWGGVNRTLAKTGESSGEGNARAQSDGTFGSNGNGLGRNDRQSEIETLAQNSGNGVDQRGEGDCDSPQSMENTWRNENQNYQDTNQLAGQGYRGGNSGRGSGQGKDQSPLTETELQALGMALADERNAQAIYLSVIDSFGQVEPFVSIAAAEQRHIDALINQFNKYGVEVPADAGLTELPVFDSISQACAASADAERANAQLYDQLFAMTDRQDLLRVLENLRRASLESHLPEFEACS